MMVITNLNDLLDLELQHLHSMEEQITKTLPAIIRETDSDDLRGALSDHLLTTQEQLARIEGVLEIRNIKRDGIIDQSVANMLKEAQELTRFITDPGIKDVAIIAGADKIEHYEMAAYENAINLAKHLNVEREYIDNLEKTRREEKAAADKMKSLANEKGILERIEDAVID